MERASVRSGAPRPLEAALLAAAIQDAVRAAREEDEPVGAIDAALRTLHEAIEGVLPSVFVLEHGRLWLLAQRGYVVMPDAIGVDQGIMGRSVRLGRGQLARTYWTPITSRRSLRSCRRLPFHSAPAG
jgi:hypothetical protein